MPPLYLQRLTADQRKDLIDKLYRMQNGNCFICEEQMDISLNELDIDHVKPFSAGGKVAEINFALTHSSSKKSEQDSNLEVARILKSFEKNERHYRQGKS
jgi:CRISPR/Cas system Type II protein with McrA/HNH and RuvC-like nuclease domain